MGHDVLGYDLHGVTLGGEVHAEAILRALDRRLKEFRTPPVADPEVRIETGNGRLTPPPGAGRPVYQSPGVELLYFEDAGELYVDHPAGVRLRCHPRSGWVRLSLPADDPNCVGLATHPLFNVALIEVLKQRGRFSVHAACVAIGDRGTLIAGPSGAGKSTLSVALARAGMAFMSDDMVFLTRSDGLVDILGFPDEVDVTDQTIAMYPELEAAAQEPSMNGRQKRSLRLEDALAVTTTLRCRPAMLLLAEVSHGDRSVAEAISAREAVVALTPNVLLTDVPAAAAHLDILSAMAQTTPCFRLKTGTDLAQIPELLASLAERSG